MEFIVTGLFIIFFSYILLYSLYDILFKRSTIEGLENGDKDEDKDKDKDEDKDEDATAKAQAGNEKSRDANEKIIKSNPESATFEAATNVANTHP
jgi:hypothetical protein